MSTTEYVLIQNVLASRWTRLLGRLLLVVAVLYGLWLAFQLVVAVRTSLLWYASVHGSQVYHQQLRAQVVLFGVFGGLMALGSALSLVRLARSAPPPATDNGEQPWRYVFSQLEPRLRRWVILVLAVWLGVRTGNRAAQSWQVYLLWRHSVPWHQKDPQFHRDISYFVEVLPFHQLVVSTLSTMTWTILLVTVVGALLYRVVVVSRSGVSVSTPFKAHLSALLALWLLLRAGLLWLGRYQLSTSSHGPVTGVSYTDSHARLPGAAILIVVALIGAAVLLANTRLRRLRVLVGVLVGVFLATQVLGNAWPALVNRFRERPSSATLDRVTIARNLAATKEAFGLGDVTTEKFDTAPTSTTTAPTPADLAAAVEQSVQVRVLDPNQLSPTFNVKQQLQAYYQFKSTLDIDHYPLQGQGQGDDQDVAIAARELNLGGISRSTWTNRHLVYTHGYGVVAAPTDQLGAETGTPVFVNGGLPPQNQIPVDQPRIYFGQNEPGYSVVGQPAGSRTDLEFDYPAASGGSAAPHTTYDGGGGVPIGSRFDRLLFAVKLHDSNLFFSSEINSASRLLSVRDPRSRVAKVAPWLSLDGDVYPVVVDGRVDWVVDGYTRTSSFPGSQQINFHQATASSLTSSGATAAQPNQNINYLHNSVKAVVDAYTGQVTLYSWDQADHPDPLLSAWERVYPGLVKPESSIPTALLAHLRYPQDLFDVQRSLLASYHVTDPSDFYNGSGFWKVPTDPTFAATSSLNSGTAASGSSPTMSSTYMTMSSTGGADSAYLLSSPLVTLSERDLAAFLSVDATPGPDYGTFTLLDVPSGGSAEAPVQIQNDIESDNDIAKALTLERGGNSRVVLGNLLTIPLAGQFLYVEPVYTQAQSANSFPILRHVIAVYGDGRPAFEDTLDAALTQAFANAAAG